MTLYGYARVSVREPEDKNLDLQVERLVRAGCSLGNIQAEEASGARNDRGGLLELLDLVVDYRANANSHTAYLMDFTAGRIATASDIPTNRKLDTPLLKRISGTEYLATRDVGMRAEEEKVATATLFIAMNPGGLEVMDLTDPGLPPDRPKDRDLAMNVISEPAIRQAMLALLVRYAVANRWPPDDIPSVAQAREVARQPRPWDGAAVGSAPRPT